MKKETVEMMLENALSLSKTRAIGGPRGCDTSCFLLLDLFSLCCLYRVRSQVARSSERACEAFSVQQQAYRCVRGSRGIHEIWALFATTHFGKSSYNFVFARIAWACCLYRVVFPVRKCGNVEIPAAAFTAFRQHLPRLSLPVSLFLCPSWALNTNQTVVLRLGVANAGVVYVAVLGSRCVYKSNLVQPWLRQGRVNRRGSSTCTPNMIPNYCWVRHWKKQN